MRSDAAARTEERVNRFRRPSVEPVNPTPTRRGGPDGGRGGWRPSPSTMRMIAAALIIVVVIVGLFATSSLWVTWWWYGSLGYRSVLVTQYIWGAIFFVVAGAIAGTFY